MSRPGDVVLYMRTRSCSEEHNLCGPYGKERIITGQYKWGWCFIYPCFLDGDVCRSAAGFSYINTPYKQRVRLLFASQRWNLTKHQGQMAWGVNYGKAHSFPVTEMEFCYSSQFLHFRMFECEISLHYSLSENTLFGYQSILHFSSDIQQMSKWLCLFRNRFPYCCTYSLLAVTIVCVFSYR